MRDLGPVRIAAVGPATAGKLNELHLRVDLQPEIYTTEKLADSLLETVASPARFCLPHGTLAGPSLAKQLREKGNAVEEWILYDTQPEPEDLTGARARYLREGAHWITFTSASTVENWHALQLQPAAGMPRPKVVSMGPVTSAALRKLGYDIVAESPVSTIDALIATICSLNIK